jgi:hypothetical protein
VIKVSISESFPITVALIDEGTGSLVSGETVTYDVRYVDDSPLSPPVSGTLTESTVEPGIYKETISIPVTGSFLYYAFCSTFITNVEEILVSSSASEDLIKQTYHHNISVEDVIRTNSTATASQIARNVPRNRTDYVITKIKDNSASDWSAPVASGIVYAHYKNTNDRVPYMMGGPL